MASRVYTLKEDQHGNIDLNEEIIFAIFVVFQNALSAQEDSKCFHQHLLKNIVVFSKMESLVPALY